jgi:transposase
LFRKAIYLNQTIELQNIIGDVELDESYFGGKRIRGFHGKLKRGRGTNKQPVFGIFKRDNILGKEVIYTEIVSDCKKDTLQGIIRGKVDLSSTITTDGWRGYDGLVDIGYNKHFRVNHGKNEFALKGEDGATVTVNGIESFWSFTKRRLSKFNGYSKYFELHLKECEWRWNKTPQELIDQLTKILKDLDKPF